VKAWRAGSRDRAAQYRQHPEIGTDREKAGKRFISHRLFRRVNVKQSNFREAENVADDEVARPEKELGATNLLPQPSVGEQNAPLDVS
jgi:hypothetical protein